MRHEKAPVFGKQPPLPRSAAAAAAALGGLVRRTHVLRRHRHGALPVLQHPSPGRGGDSHNPPVRAAARIPYRQHPVVAPNSPASILHRAGGDDGVGSGCRKRGDLGTQRSGGRGWGGRRGRGSSGGVRAGARGGHLCGAAHLVPGVQVGLPCPIFTRVCRCAFATSPFDCTAWKLRKLCSSANAGRYTFSLVTFCEACTVTHAVEK